MLKKLERPVKRVMKGKINGKEFVVELDFPDTIKFRTKRGKTVYSAPLSKVFNLALYQYMLEDYEAKIQKFKVDKSAGKNPKRPKKPNLYMFDQKLLKLFNK